MIPQAVRFAAYAGVFRIEFIPWPDLECQTGDITAYLQQQTERGQYLSKGLRLEIRLDPIAWREVNPPQRSPREMKLVEEFLQQYPQEGRAPLRELVAERRRQADRLAKCSLSSDQLNGSLVSLADLVVENSAYSCGPFGLYEQVYWDGGIYYVEDCYCGNPDCHCEVAHLMFLDVIKNDEGKDVLESLFWAEVPLDRSKAAKIVQTVSCSSNLAMLLLDTWLKRRLEETLRLWPRYNLVKKIALRSIHNPRALAPEVEPSRNETCPCGSGRKYKNCCGKE